MPNCAMSEPEPLTPLGPIVADRLLDGRLTLWQPQKGHRAGSDAILLAAALPDLAGGPLLDMGAGVGTVGLAAAVSDPQLHVVLVERDRDLAALARRNVAENELSGRVGVFAVDIEASAASLASAGLQPGGFACVAMNPPFYAPHATRSSPVANRAAAHVADGSLGTWFKAARRLLRPGGRLTLIHRAEALPEVLAALDTGFGGVVIRPVHALPDRPAVRILVTAQLNSKRPAALLPAFVLNRAEGGFTPAAEAVHRGAARLILSAG